MRFQPSLILMSFALYAASGCAFVETDPSILGSQDDELSAGRCARGRKLCATPTGNICIRNTATCPALPTAPATSYAHAAACPRVPGATVIACGAPRGSKVIEISDTTVVSQSPSGALYTQAIGSSTATLATFAPRRAGAYLADTWYDIVGTRLVKFTRSGQQSVELGEEARNVRSVLVSPARIVLEMEGGSFASGVLEVDTSFNGDLRILAGGQQLSGFGQVALTPGNDLFQVVGSGWGYGGVVRYDNASDMFVDTAPSSSATGRVEQVHSFLAFNANSSFFYGLRYDEQEVGSGGASTPFIRRIRNGSGAVSTFDLRSYVEPIAGGDAFRQLAAGDTRIFYRGQGATDSSGLPQEFAVGSVGIDGTNERIDLRVPNSAGVARSLIAKGDRAIVSLDPSSGTPQSLVLATP